MGAQCRSGGGGPSPLRGDWDLDRGTLVRSKGRGHSPPPTVCSGWPPQVDWLQEG